MGKLTTKQLKHKFTDGTEELVDLAVNAENVEEINFVTAENRENIRPREGLIVIFGKISKWYASLKNVAWSGSYNDLADKPALNDIEGILSVAKGGTGANSEAAARKNLGLGAAATYGVSGNDTTNDTGLLANAAVVYNHRIEIDNLKKSFLDGVNKIYNKLKGLGFTPATKGPDDICKAIQKVFDDRYAAGRTQGREDVKASPETYGVSTASKLAQLVTPGLQMNHNIASFTCPKTGTYHIKVQYINMNNGNHNACHTLVRLTVPGNIYTFVNKHYDSETNSFINDNINASNGQIITVNANAGNVFSLEVGGNDISASYDGDAQLRLFYAAAMWEIY